MWMSLPHSSYFTYIIDAPSRVTARTGLDGARRAPVGSCATAARRCVAADSDTNLVADVFLYAAIVAR
jgi:hypothetical protein